MLGLLDVWSKTNKSLPSTGIFKGLTNFAIFSLGILFIPFTGCAIGVGLIFASLLKSVSYAPDYEEILFNYAMLGFAFIETFEFLLFFILAVIIAF